MRRVVGAKVKREVELRADAKRDLPVGQFVHKRCVFDCMDAVVDRVVPRREMASHTSSGPLDSLA
jgi:hypothetical protein